MTESWDDGTNYDDGYVYDNSYLDLITSEHQKPKFLSMISALTQPFIDAQNVANSIPQLFDVDQAVGVQLDATGLWIGETRDLVVPLTGVYFSFDTAGLGFDEGTILGPYDPTTQLDVLPDDSFRTLLYARIANNAWDGTIPGAYEFMDQVFPGNTFFIQDNQDMSMLIGVVGSTPLNAVTYALLTGGYLDIKPAGVMVDGYATASVPDAPLFGFDAENSLISGLDVGCYATIQGGN